MPTDYTALDAAILEHIRSGSPWHPMYTSTCRTALARVNPAWAHHPHKIADRLQALRKAGKIRHDGSNPNGASHGWIIVEAPTNA